MAGIGTVGDGMGMGFKGVKDDPMQLSDILPKTLMYDKMRPPKVEGNVKDTLEDIRTVSGKNQMTDMATVFPTYPQTTQQVFCSLAQSQ